MAEAYIVEAVRTAGGRRGGKLAGWHPADMGGAVLDAIVDRALDVNDLSDLYSPAEIIRQTRDFRAFGMPDHLIAIASDCSGNQFCFDETELKAGSADGPAIWFFDHDFGTTAKIAPDFEAWIDAFCAIEPSDPT